MSDTKKHMDKGVRSLRDFTRLALAFFFSLVILAVYQQTRLYLSGVLDQILGKSLFLLVVHHIGFTALVSLPLAFIFKALERRKPLLGFKITAVLFYALLLAELVLVNYYVTHFEILGEGFLALYKARTSMSEFAITLLLAVPLCMIVFYLFYRLCSSMYSIIGRMYPFTVILFSLFLATLYSDKKPINENKSQHLVVHATTYALDLNKYDGDEPYPLMKKFSPSDELNALFELKEGPPNLVFIILEGIGADFVGPDAVYNGFTPFLDSLATRSLYWSNHLSNTGEGHASLPTILGSLPFGETGFNKSATSIHRNTLLGILKKNGYATAFNYGGNSALYQWDKFLFEDRVDQLTDFKAFGPSYTMQEEDAAGISLGYPDGELYRKWLADKEDPGRPFMEVLFTLSSKKPFEIPDKERYINKVESIIEKAPRPRAAQKIIRKNKEIFASLLYADQALAAYIKHFKKLAVYENTIFVITGSHNMTELPPANDLSRYRVPLIIYSPLINKPMEIRSLASHADIAPSILALLGKRYNMKVPGKASFIGEGLASGNRAQKGKKIPLYRHAFAVKDFIHAPYFFTAGTLYKLGERNLRLEDAEDDAPRAEIIKEFRDFKAINKYVVGENKLIPPQSTLFAQLTHEPTKQEIIWINSVFNGADFDNAYKTARSLAINGQYERALLLSSYILNQVPGHADTEILMGRIHAWRGNYETSIEILEGCILKYPVYPDAYSALLDVYFWSGQNKRAISLGRQIERHDVENEELKGKMDRAVNAMLEISREENNKTGVQPASLPNK